MGSNPTLSARSMTWARLKPWPFCFNRVNSPLSRAVDGTCFGTCLWPRARVIAGVWRNDRSRVPWNWYLPSLGYHGTGTYPPSGTMELVPALPRVPWNWYLPSLGYHGTGTCPPSGTMELVPALPRLPWNWYLPCPGYHGAGHPTLTQSAAGVPANPENPIS